MYSNMAEQQQEGGAVADNFNHKVTCHCGNICGSFRSTSDHITAWDCNCSDCNMRKNIHFVVPSDDFKVDGTIEEYEENTIQYLWGTGTAKRRFCKMCGILPWYIPRSNPDGIAITLACAKFDPGRRAPSITIKKYDGINWEKSHKESGIAKESSKHI